MAVTQSGLSTLMQGDLERVDARVRAAAAVEYPGIAEILEEIVSAGGKRLRPLLVLLAGRAFEYESNLDNLVTAAAGVELLHTASLVHDDTIDRAAIRRGRPTLNSVFSPGAVILIGDYLFAQSAMLAADTGIPRVVKVFATTLGDICDGQLLEMTSGHLLDQSQDDYLKRIDGKTASLFAGAAEMGAVIATAPEAQVNALRQFGADAGLAFQIIDDILDLTADDTQIGKPAGHDLREGTLTLPVLIYLATAAAAERELIAAVVSGEATSEPETEALVGRIRNSDAIEQSHAIAKTYADSAAATAKLAPDVETASLLLEFLDQSIERQS